MALMDMFRTPPAAKAAPAEESAPVTDTAEAKKTTEPEKEISPMDSFKSLWDTNDTDSDDDTDLSSIITIDEDKIRETVGSIDFSKVVDADMLAKINEGGEGATAAFLAAMNKMAQTTFSQSMIANATLTKKALEAANTKLDKRTSNALRNSKISEGVDSISPVLSHSSVAPLVNLVKSELAAKYPTATSEEITKQANSYFTEFANQLTKSKDTPTKEVKGTDFSTWG